MFVFIGDKASDAAAAAAIMGHPIIRVADAYRAAAAALGPHVSAEDIWKLTRKQYREQGQAHPLSRNLCEWINRSYAGIKPPIITDCLNEDMLLLLKVRFSVFIVGVGTVSWGEDLCDDVAKDVVALQNKVLTDWDLVPALAEVLAPIKTANMEDLLMSVASLDTLHSTWKKAYMRDRERRL